MAIAQDAEAQADPAGLLRLAMRGLVKSVALISTADAKGGRHVMAVTAVTPVSMDPPSMLFCMNRSTSLYPAIAGGADFCVNILAVDHLALARRCSGPIKGEERFDDGAWVKDERGVPYLADAQAAVICTQEQRHPYGTHDIVVGKVRRVLVVREIDPLVYVDGVYKPLRGEALSP